MSFFSFSFWVVVILEGIMVFGYSLSFPFLAIYLNQHGYDMTSIGFYLSVVMFISSIANTVGGGWSDYVGRKKVIFYSLFLRGFFTAIIAVVVKWQLSGGYIIFLNLLSSISSLGFHSVVVAYLSDMVEEKDRIKAFSILRISTNVGWTLGPAVGGFLADFGYFITFAFSSFVFMLLSLFSFLYLPQFKKEHSHKKLHFSFKLDYFFTKELILVFIYSFFMTAVMAHLVVPLSLYSKKYLGFSEKEIGFLFTVNGAFVIAVQYFVGRLIKNEKIHLFLFISCILYGVGYLLYGYSVSYSMAIISMIVITTGEVIFSPSLTAYVSQIVPESKKGSYIGFHSMVAEFGRGFGVFMGSFLIDSFSPHFKQAPWYVVLIISVLSGVGFIKLKGIKK